MSPRTPSLETKFDRKISSDFFQGRSFDILNVSGNPFVNAPSGAPFPARLYLRNFLCFLGSLPK